MRNIQKESFTDDFVTYVSELDADEDIRFLNICGWDVPVDIAIPLKVFTFFLRKMGGASAYCAGSRFLCPNRYKTACAQPTRRACSQR